MSENAKLTRGSIRGHLVSQTLPAIVGVAAVMSIGLVDAYFIGQLGADALGAIAASSTSHGWKSLAMLPKIHWPTYATKGARQIASRSGNR